MRDEGLHIIINGVFGPLEISWSRLASVTTVHEVTKSYICSGCYIVGNFDFHITNLFLRGFFLVLIFPFAALLAMMGRADKPNKDLELVDGEFSLLGAFLYNVVSFFPSAFLFLFFLFACTTLQHLAGHRKSPTVSCI